MANNFMEEIYGEDYIEHHGVKGMKWGVRRSPEQLGHRIVNSHRDRHERKEARKDAKEFARAKMFYGEGAGNRRKLIKATVKQKSKSKVYADEFEKSLNSQNMADHASKAKKRAKSKRCEKHSREMGTRRCKHSCWEPPTSSGKRCSCIWIVESDRC